MESQKIFLFSETQLQELIKATIGIIGITMIMHDDDDKENISEKIMQKTNNFTKKVIKIKTENKEFIEKNE